MADDDQGARTREQREAAIKDLSAVFDKHARSLNKVYLSNTNPLSTLFLVFSNELLICRKVLSRGG